MPTLRQATKDDIMLIHELAQQAFSATCGPPFPGPDGIHDGLDVFPANLLKQMEEGHVTSSPPTKGNTAATFPCSRRNRASSTCRRFTCCPASRKHIGSYLFRQAVSYIRSIHPAPCQMRLNVNRYNTRAVQISTTAWE